VPAQAWGIYCILSPVTNSLISSYLIDGGKKYARENLTMTLKWLEQRLETFIPALAPLGLAQEPEIAALCAAEIAAWKSRPTMKAERSWRNPMLQTRRALEQIPLTQDNSWHNPKYNRQEHIALKYMDFLPSEWTAMNASTSVQLENRLSNSKFITDPDAIVAASDALLKSKYWADIAAGLVVNTGRRHTELMKTAEFEPMTPYSLRFSGQLKSIGQASFEIPTFSRADKVLSALQELRTIIDCAQMTKTEVNQKFSGKLIQTVDSHFAGLVPQREGKDNLYTHLFRAVYARLAVWYYCPPHVADILFMAQIQGHFHFLNADSEEYRLNFASTAHYYDYQIASSLIAAHGGQRQGIWLGKPGVEVLQVLQPAATEAKASVAPQVPLLQPAPSVAKAPAALDPVIQSAEAGAEVPAGLDPVIQIATAQTLAPALLDPVLQSTSPPAVISQPSDTLAASQMYALCELLQVPPNQLVALVQQLHTLAESALSVSYLLQVPADGLTAKVQELHTLADSAISASQLLHVPRAELVPQVQELLAANQWATCARALSQLLQTTTPEATLSAAQSLVAAAQAPLTTASLEPPAPHPALDKLLALTDSLSELLGGASTLDETRLRLHALLQGTAPATTPQLQMAPAVPTGTTPAAKPSPAKSTTTPTAKTTTQPPSTTAAQKNPRKTPGSAEERIDHAVQAVMHHNDYVATEKSHKWALTASAVGRLSGSNRPAIDRYFEAHHLAISDHNAKHELSEGHNIPKGRRGEKIEHLIQVGVLARV